MVYNDRHLNWLIDTGIKISTIEGENVQVLEFNHQSDEAILTEWARYY